MGAGAVRSLRVVEDPHEDLQELLEAMVTRLVDRPDDIVIKTMKAADGSSITFEVFCDEDDVGAVLGSRGRHAEAMRTLLTAAAAAMRTRVYVQFLSRDHDGMPPR